MHTYVGTESMRIRLL